MSLLVLSSHGPWHSAVSLLLMWRAVANFPLSLLVGAGEISDERLDPSQKCDLGSDCIIVRRAQLIMSKRLPSVRGQADLFRYISQLRFTVLAYQKIIVVRSPPDSSYSPARQPISLNYLKMRTSVCILATLFLSVLSVASMPLPTASGRMSSNSLYRSDTDLKQT